MIAEVIRAHEAGGKKAPKMKGKKSKKGKSKEAGAKETGSILKELKNALRPVTVDRRGEEGSRPSTPMRSAHDQLMESIRNSSIRNLKRVRKSLITQQRAQKRENYIRLLLHLQQTLDLCGAVAYMMEQMMLD